MGRTKPGASRLGIDLLFDRTYHPLQGVATDGVVYSPVATFGTTAVEIFNALIDPGVTVGLKELEVGLTQKFTGLNASVAGSLSYYWLIRSEADVPSGPGLFRYMGSYRNVTGTFTKGVGTLIASEDTFAGRVSLAGISFTPVRISLMAQCLAAANMKGEVKSSTYVRPIGIVVPGT